MTILTPKQSIVLKALKEYYVKANHMPTLRELKDFLAKQYKFQLQNVRSIAQYLESLEHKGFIRRGSAAREIEFIDPKKSHFWHVPVVGWVSAGTATAIPQDSITGYLKVSRSLLPRIGGSVIAVEVDGDSMSTYKLNTKYVEDGDFVLVNKDYKAFTDGDVVVADIDGALTVKEFRRVDTATVGLFPHSKNNVHKPIYLTKEDQFLLLGKVVDVYKKS